MLRSSYIHLDVSVFTDVLDVLHHAVQTCSRCFCHCLRLNFIATSTSPKSGICVSCFNLAFVLESSLPRQKPETAYLTFPAFNPYTHTHTHTHTHTGLRHSSLPKRGHTLAPHTHTAPPPSSLSQRLHTHTHTHTPRARE